MYVSSHALSNREFTQRQEYDYDYVNGCLKGLGLIVIVSLMLAYASFILRFMNNIEYDHLGYCRSFMNNSEYDHLGYCRSFMNNIEYDHLGYCLTLYITMNFER